MASAFDSEAEAAQAQLLATYGTADLTDVDKVVLMDGWNKILGWETMWKEACWFRWRILVAREELRNPTKDRDQYADSDTPRLSLAEAARQARLQLEANEDPIGKFLGTRKWDGKNMLLSLFDEQIRSLCPHTQTVQREAYRKVTGDRGAAFWTHPRMHHHQGHSSSF